MEDLAFDTNGDVLDVPGRVVQPGSFTLRVEERSAQVVLQGSTLDEADWVRLSTYAS